MKKQSNLLFAQMSSEQSALLTGLVKETGASGLNNNIGKKFTTADLWNIQRQGKSGMFRRTFA